MIFIHSLKRTVFILTGKLAIIHFLSDSFSSSILVVFGCSYAFFQVYYNYFYRILAVIHSFNGTVYFSHVKMSSHPILLTYILSAYFRTPVTVKLTSYRSSYIFRAASILLDRAVKFLSCLILMNTCQN